MIYIKYTQMPFLDYIDDNGVVSKVEWTPLKEVEMVQTKEIKLVLPMTFGEEVEELVREWYSNRNMPIPPEELQACREIDIIQSAQNKKEAETPVVSKPVYGTPEFWKDWWAKKRAKEANGDEPKNTGSKKSENSNNKNELKKQKPLVPKSAKLTGQASQN